MNRLFAAALAGYAVWKVVRGAGRPRQRLDWLYVLGGVEMVHPDAPYPESGLIFAGSSSGGVNVLEWT